MAIPLLFSLLLLLNLSSSLAFDLSTTAPPPSPQQQPPPLPQPQELLHDHSFFSHTALLTPILSHLGFNELAMAAPSLSSDTSSTTAWSGPSTLFAPSDSSLRTCFSCSVPSLLREHIVPGLFTIDYLRKLAFGTKIETLSPGHCITVTSTPPKNATSTNAFKIFIGGVEITHPDLFNNGLIVIHGIQGFVSPLSPFSCDVERMTSLSFPFQPADRGETHQNSQFASVQPAIMRLMLRDSMLRLRGNGFSILSLAMKVKYAELASLNNMTMFALDDVAIFSGSHGYISSVRFHIVPNHLLTMADLERLPVGTTLPTLERGQSLVVTTAGGGVGIGTAPLRINYVRVKVPDVMRNLKIVVHSVYLPFPRIHSTASVYDGILGGTGSDGGDHAVALDGACAALEDHDGCDVAPMPNIKPTVEIEDHHGL
ncbi:hypothetical protein CFOL_v3_19094 [Cephalotus follicularis]|uniref:FAS1 domain-containing protein n=1 Tax=Cephalotus follicularis TaxID=3775 RepID=A0A1Q3C5P6_CEPFO|nr:hypothetical protein CFOL_v3_19094 [Cephalotus follicularis]